jgi:hypothetical protein
MQHATDDEHGWDEWFDADDAQERAEPRGAGLGRYILYGLAIEAVVLVVALAGA